MVPPKNLNILFISTYFYPYLSGLTDYPLTVAAHLAQKHRVAVLTFRHQKDLSLVEKYQDIAIYRLPVHLRVFKGLWHFFYPIKAWQMVKKNDVVFVNLPSFEGFWPALAGRLLRKKVFVIYHCELAFDRGIWIQLAAWAGNASAWLSCLLATKIIVYTKDYARHSTILRGCLPKTIDVLPPVRGYQADQVYRGYLEKIIKRKKPIIGFAGRVAREKGLEYLLGALEIMRNMGARYRKTVLLIAGPYGKEVAGEAGYFTKIKSTAAQAQIDVRFLGSLDKRRLSAFYRTIDLLVLPSVNKTEAFGMVQAEAMLSGTPVIASDLPGVRQAIRLTRMGLTARPADSRDLADKICRLLKNKKQYAGRQSAAVRRFRIESTLRFYERLIS